MQSLCSFTSFDTASRARCQCQASFSVSVTSTSAPLDPSSSVGMMWPRLRTEARAA